MAVLDDGIPEGVMLSSRFAAEAERTGLEVVHRRRWDPQATGYARLGRHVAAARPDAVFVAGLLDTRGADVVRALRARLGPDPLVLVPTGFTPTSAFADEAGPAAEGAYLSLPGVIPQAIPPGAGRRFTERFGATQPGAQVEPSSLYAAESTHVMLDAIARSDGTRASVLEELFATRRRDSLLGDVAFDRNGDVRSSPVTVLRIRRGADGLGEGLPDAVVDRVVR